MKKALVLLACLLLAGQMAMGYGFAKNSSYLGPLVGFGWHDLMLGGQFEYGASRSVGFGFIGGYSHKGYDYYWGNLSYNYVSLGFQCNYHFRSVKPFDLYAGGLLGYDIVSYSEKYHPGYEWYHGWSATGSALFIGPQLGANFPLGRSAAFSTRLGYPFYLAVGMNFKL